MPPGMLYPANARQREFIISPLKYIPAGFQWRGGVTPTEHVRKGPRSDFKPTARTEDGSSLSRWTCVSVS